MSELKPLTPVESLLLPIIRLGKKGSEAEKLNRRMEYTKLRRSRLRDQKKMVKALTKEQQLYEKLIIDCYIRIGQAWMVGAAGVETGGKAPKKAKVQKVRFSRKFFTEEMMWFEVQVNRRWLHTTKNMLPHHVLAANLVSDVAKFELMHACKRFVTFSYTDPRYGLWIIVHRLVGIDGIPLYVTYKEMLEHYPASKIDEAPLLGGAGENRKLVLFDFATRPHMMVAGSTRSGKSNFINGMICNFLRFSRPEQLQLILIDFKRLEFNYYADSPHLWHRRIVEEPEEAIQCLSDLIELIHSRAKLMKNRAKELADFNLQFPDEAMTRIICIIDEYGELVLQGESEQRRAVLKLTTRIGNLGRAVGVHLVLCTQHPERAVVPAAIKTNFPIVFAGRVQNASQSIVIIGRGDASKLPILPGRMIFSDGPDLAQVQTPHIKDDDIKEAVAISKGRHLGVIDLDGWEPVIEPDGLMCYIVDKLGGRLINENYKHLRALAVPMRALKLFLQTVIQKGSYKAGDREFLIEQYQNYWIVKEPNPVEPAVTKPDIERIIGLLKQPVILALPAPKMADPIIEPVDPPDAPEPIPVIHPLMMTHDQILDQFLSLACEHGGSYKVMMADLYKSYTEFCRQLDEQIDPLSTRELGHMLTKRGYKVKHLMNGNARIGIRLNGNYEPHERHETSDPDMAAA